MAYYSIKELEHLSGIKAHTLRIWEQRYNLLQPKRTDTNIRYYDDADLKNLLNVALLYQEGYKISKIAQLPPTEIAQEVMKLTDTDLGQEQFINQLIVAMVELDEVLFERVLHRAILQLGFPVSVRQVVYPFLYKIGMLWQTANITPAHEHFMSQLIRQKMLVAIDGLPIPSGKKSPRVILFLPEGELHELSLLFAHYLLRSAGFSTLYLGQHLPLADLVRAAQQYQPAYLFSVLTTPVLKVSVLEYLKQLSEEVSAQEVLVCGAQLNSYAQEDMPAKVVLSKSLDALELWIQKVSEAKIEAELL
ncbi:hypothetical protein TH63_10605 [Rufibacter radiotolerans]|uniref:HTH merR-type domain-containing protein n=1 Tax=Rufibacter radiotolerans TaxID=1379910 RepID=A0A0H4VQG9_9BACT|nr:MerR family transcriptional regulator [Rufibacter radiotolerans]AKQ45994.1 hypothetical protein TH63_10605 [Rufibacter radiotolerans]